MNPTSLRSPFTIFFLSERHTPFFANQLPFLVGSRSVHSIRHCSILRAPGIDHWAVTIPKWLKAFQDQRLSCRTGFKHSSSMRYFSILGRDEGNHKQDQIKLSPEQLRIISNLFSLVESTQEACFIAVFAACKERDWVKIQSIQKECDHLVNAQGCSLLLEALDQGETELAQDLLKRNFSVHTLDHASNNALHYAIKAGDRELIAKLWKHLDINQANSQNQTPLHLAVEHNQPQLVSDLLANGARIEARARFSFGNTLFSEMTPLHIAIIKDHRHCLDVLLPPMADKLPFHKELGNLLHVAIHFRQYYVLKQLLTTHFSLIQPLLDQPNSEGLTPAMCAAYSGETQMLILLKEKRADLTCKDPQGKLALHWATLGRQESSIALLYYWDCDLNARDSDHNCPYDLVRTATDPLSRSIANQLSNLGRQKEKVKEIPSVYTIHPPENLVFKGGGPKGIAYVGAVEALEKEGALREVIRVAGTSAGAINSTFMAIGFTAEEMGKILGETNLASFLDHPLSKEKIQTTFSDLSFKSSLHILFNTFTTLATTISNPLSIFKKIWSITGVCEGKVFREWIEKHIQTKTGIADCTFGELAALIQSGKPFKHLHVFTSEIGQGKLAQIHSEDPQWKDVIIADAVRASISIPGVFNPHILHVKQGGKRLPAPELGIHVDGGMIRNFPIDAFDKRKYLPSSPKGPTKEWHAFNRRTLGLSLFSPKEKEVKPSHPPETVGDLLLSVMQIYHRAETFYRELVFDNQFRVIDIDNQGVGLLEFGLSPEKQHALMTSGKQAVQRFYDAQRELTTRENSLYLFTRTLLQARQSINLDLSPQEFVGRTTYLEQLAKTLLEPSAPLLQVVLSGPSGTGKTSTALAFAKKHLQDFSLIWWISSGTPSTLKTSYRSLAKELGISHKPTDSFTSLQKKVHRSLETREHSKPYLLIFDNAEEALSLPKGGKGRILITSRYKNLWKEPLEMLPFTEEEAIQLLVKILKVDPKQEPLAILAKQLGYLPLALAQVGRYLAITPGMTPQTYLEMLEKQTKASFELAVPEASYPLSLMASWQITQDSLQKAHPLALRWLHCCASLHPEGIPLSWIQTWLQKEKADPFQCQIEQGNILQTLTDRGLIQYNREQQTFSLHRLYQTLCHATPLIASQEEREAEAVHLLCQVAENLDINRLADWPLYAKWAPHAEVVLAKPPTRTLKVGVLANKLGQWMHTMGQSQQALTLSQRALEIREKESGSDHPDVAHSLNNIGLSLAKLGQYQEALGYHKKALAIWEKRLESDHPDVAQSLNNIGVNLAELSQYQEALGYYKKALAIWEKRLGSDHPHVAVSLNNIGVRLADLGQHPEALEYYKKALVIQEKRLGSDHPDVAQSLNNIGGRLAALDQHQEALKYHKKALTIREKRLGSDHPDVAQSLNNIGGRLDALGQHQEALGYYKKALVIQEKKLGNDHPDVARSLNNIGGSLVYLSEHQEALRYHKKALAIWEKRLGSDHPDVTHSLNNIGVSLARLDQHQEALGYHKKALAIREKRLGSDHPHVAQSLNNIGWSLARLGQHQEALEYHKKALAIREKRLGSDHPDVAHSLNNIGWSLARLGQHQEALEYHKKALAIREKRLGSDHPDVAQSLNHIGVSLADLGQHQEALEYHKKALVIQEKRLGSDHPDEAHSLNNIGVSLARLGQYEEALGYYKRAISIACRTFKGEHPILVNSLQLTIQALSQIENTKLVEQTKKELISLCQQALGENHAEIQALMAVKPKGRCIIM